MKSTICTLGIVFTLGACSLSQSEQTTPADTYWQSLQSLCDGDAYAGQLVSNDAVDADFAAAEIIIGPAKCSMNSVRIPLAVGDDRSRTWVVTKTQTGLRLKHDHRHKDGTEDVITQYGGDAIHPGTPQRNEFPVDAETRDLFTREDIAVSNQNTWAVEIDPAQLFAYEMQRPERFFRLEFDLSEAAPSPPPPWGVEPVE